MNEPTKGVTKDIGYWRTFRSMWPLGPGAGFALWLLVAACNDWSEERMFRRSDGSFGTITAGQEFMYTLPVILVLGYVVSLGLCLFFNVFVRIPVVLFRADWFDAFPRTRESRGLSGPSENGQFAVILAAIIIGGIGLLTWGDF